MPENPVEKAIREAEQACQMAISGTPEAYRGFITLISQNKRVGGSKQSPLYATIRLPYMDVDGRVRMAMDEHREAGAMISVDTTFETVDGKLMCVAVVTSALIGSAKGVSEVKYGGTGVDASHPFENAQTSAIGRALGFLGYGLYGTGIASAEEVLAAMGTAPSDGEPAPTSRPQDPAKKEQIGLLYGMLKECGVADGDKRELVSHAYPAGIGKQEATEAIDYLKSAKTLPNVFRNAYVAMLIKRHGLDRKKIAAHMDEVYGHHAPDKLLHADFLALVKHCSPESEQVEEDDDIYMPGETMKVPTVQDWIEFSKGVCQSGQFSVTHFEKWILSNFSDGSIKDMSKLPVEVFHSLTSRDVDSLVTEVKASLTEESNQATLVS